MPDHVHILTGMRSTQSVADLMREIKAGSSKFINDSKLVRGRFSWQEGYGAFSYSKSQVQKVIQYILNQPKHHIKKGFREEYLDILKKFEIDYDENFLFEWIK